jgi:hypothetical protein
VAIVLSNGEIFSNLLFTQRLHDLLQPNGSEPIVVNDAVRASEQLIPSLLKEDSVSDAQILIGGDLGTFLEGVRAMDEAALGEMLRLARQETEGYHNSYIAKQPKKK